jgi:hypothetical protein
LPIFLLLRQGRARRANRCRRAGCAITGLVTTTRVNEPGRKSRPMFLRGMDT